MLLAAAALPLHLDTVDRQVFVWLHLHGGFLRPSAWAGFTVLGDGLSVFALVALLSRYSPLLVWSCMLAAIFGTAWTHGLKLLIGGPRPAALLDPAQLEIIGPLLRGNAFPSGHALAIVSFCTILVFALRSRTLRILVGTFAAVVALSRIMVGAHWPIDVVYGALGGWLSALLALRLSRRWRWGMHPLMQRLFNGLLLSASATLLIYDAGYPGSERVLVALGAMGVAACCGNFFIPTQPLPRAVLGARPSHEQ